MNNKHKHFQAAIAKNNGPKLFVVMWVGDLISTIGSGLSAFVLGAYAFKLTGKATSATLVVLFTFLPAFILRPFGGVLADRVNRAKLMIVGNIGSALGILLVFCMISWQPDNLLMIYPGVALSSIFVALQNPAFKASITDLLPSEMFVKASGLVQLSGSAQFLISPLLAGMLMLVLKVQNILVLDIFSFLGSALAVYLIRHAIKNNSAKDHEKTHFFHDLKEGWMSMVADRGIVILVSLLTLSLFSIGLIQALLAPMVLSFASARELGSAQSACAIGMLVSSIIVSTHHRKGNNVLILCVSLALMGLSYAFIGVKPNFWAVVIPGFLFFATLPFANSSLDFLIRQNISNEKQGRVWAFISFVTSFGAILAYGISGFLADKVFNPLFRPNGLWANSLGQFFGVGEGRGIAFMFFLAGIFISVISLFMYRSKEIHKLELTQLNATQSILPVEIAVI